ncbi:cold-regulated 413 plasma membrane protein 2-like [Dioscorea cayenensis subsp. rotundata]|uniref:Cold-regulated 413 plasma membrane protein 2-like n=1 Tax=Dioscorea cayennensis subsp. rotundata TaxID=55577 RepID=A0AB40CK33_DIOCR|nr:cold-regulated 413 plasma membrane protein 2-like [Dioscorea cayenensis subsp. rotundata]
MGKFAYLAVEPNADLIDSDLREVAGATKKLFNHAFILAGGISFGTTFLKSIASFAAIYLLILDRTNWRTNISTFLLVPYIFFSLPTLLFSFLRGELGKWLALVAVLVRLFFPKHFPDWLELPASLILLLAIAPDLLAHSIRDSILGPCTCFFVSCFLVQEHIRASGGFKNSFTKSRGLSNCIGLVLILIYPTWSMILYFI